MKKPVGQTKDTGFQFGIRKTFPVSLDRARQFLFSDDGLKIWLGNLISGSIEEKKQFKTADGTEGMVRVLKPLSHIRLTWKKKEWDNFSTLQIRVIGTKGKTTISFHQEKLLNSQQRIEVRFYWQKVMAKIAEKF